MSFAAHETNCIENKYLGEYEKYASDNIFNGFLN